MPLLQKRVHFAAVGIFGTAVVRLLRRSWRIRISEPGVLCEDVLSRGRRVIAAFWHRHLLMLLAAYRNYPICVPVSEHRDGEYVAQIMERNGLLAVRGSSTRGAVRLLRSLTEASQAGWNIAVTPDGPRGPRYSVKPGFAMLARRTRTPVVSMGVAVDRAWEFNSWDGFMIPKPGARVCISIGEEFTVQAMEGMTSAELCAELKRRIDAANEMAAQELAQWTGRGAD